MYLYFFCIFLLYCKILYCIVSSYFSLFFVFYLSVFSAYVANKRLHYVRRADNLEKKMVSLKNFERLQELQQQIVWQSVLELEPRSLVPEASMFDVPLPRVEVKSKVK